MCSVQGQYDLARQHDFCHFQIGGLHCRNIFAFFNKDLCYVSCTSVPLSILAGSAPMYYTITTFPYHVDTAQPKVDVMIKCLVDKSATYMALQLM